jgi:hypothetical protein
MDQITNEDYKNQLYPVIKKDAVITVKVGTGYLKRLQEVLHFIVKDKSAEEFEQYKKEVTAMQNSKNPSFNEEWKGHVTTLGLLITEIEKSAMAQGLTENRSYDELMNLVNKL